MIADIAAVGSPYRAESRFWGNLGLFWPIRLLWWHASFGVLEECILVDLRKAPFFNILAISSFGRNWTVDIGHSLTLSNNVLTKEHFRPNFAWFSENFAPIIAKISFLFKRFAWKTAKKCSQAIPPIWWESELFESVASIHFFAIYFCLRSNCTRFLLVNYNQKSKSIHYAP